MSPDRAPRGSHTRRAPYVTGFTLIELLVVVFIIGILVALTLTIVPKVKRAVYTAETQAQLSALSNAIQQYYNDYKSYPGPLPNNQLYWSYDSYVNNNQYGMNVNQPIVVASPTVSFPLEGFAPTNYPSLYDPPATTSFGYNITSSQNLVLGLLGGLELQTTNNGTTLSGFIYNPQDIFSDGVTPAPKGPASLNFASPRRQNAYINVKLGDLSTPNIKNINSVNAGTGASFADGANRSPNDAMIPVFLDKYSDPMPILYYRTNVGGNAIVGFRKSGAFVNDQGNKLQDSNGNNEAAQYDLDQNLPYVTSSIGTNGHNTSSIHGLIGITAPSNAMQGLLITGTSLVDNIDSVANGQNTPNNGGSNGLAYFKDPSVNSTVYDNTTSNTHLGVARQKDGYILISAGPDRLYGTHDDQIFPGPLQP